MDATPDTPQPDGGAQRAETREELRVTVRRSPKYGVFMAIGAVVGIVAAWILSSAGAPGVDEAGQPVDTTPVVGLMVVIGVVVGGVLGGIVALIVDRSLARGTRTVVAERVETRDTRTESDGDVDEAVFEHFDAAPDASAPDASGPAGSEPAGSEPMVGPEDDRPRGA